MYKYMNPCIIKELVLDWHCLFFFDFFLSNVPLLYCFCLFLFPVSYVSLYKCFVFDTMEKN